MKRIVSILLVLLFVAVASLPAFAEEKAPELLVSSDTSCTTGYRFDSFGGLISTPYWGVTTYISIAPYSSISISSSFPTVGQYYVVVYDATLNFLRTIDISNTSNTVISFVDGDAYIRCPVVLSGGDSTATIYGIYKPDIVDPTPGGTVTVEPRPLLETPLADLEVTEGLLLVIVCVLLISMIVRAFAK